MKKQYIKIISSTLIVGVFLFLAFGSDYSSKNDENIQKESIESTVSEPTESKQKEAPKVSNIASAITKNLYESTENGLKTYLYFESSEGTDGYFGSLTMSNSISKCKYVYSYSIDENSINTKFYGSDCGGTENNMTYFYNESQNTISCFIKGQEFIFYSVF